MTIGQDQAQAVTALNRFGLGARPGDLARASGDPRGLLLEELRTPVALIRNGPARRRRGLAGHGDAENRQGEAVAGRQGGGRGKISLVTAHGAGLRGWT